MGFYTYKKDLLSFKKIKINFKLIFYIFIIQVFISIFLLFTLSTFYETPKEKKLKQDISYLLYEFNELNKRVLESGFILDEIKEKDSLIYKTILNIPYHKENSFDIYYESNVNNNYVETVKESNKKISIFQERLSKELYTLKGLIREANYRQEMFSHLPAIQPIENKKLKRVACGWGFRIHPIYYIKKFHFGLDFTAPEGTFVYSTADGTVENVIKLTDKSSQGYGNFIIINHGYGYKTLYAHLNKSNVKPKQKVKRGQIIGFVGNTGISTGPHLHYEIIKNGQKVNPIFYLFNSLTPEEYKQIIELSNSITKSYD